MSNKTNRKKQTVSTLLFVSLYKCSQLANCPHIMEYNVAFAVEVLNIWGQ